MKSPKRDSLKRQMDALQAQMQDVSRQEESNAGKLARKAGLLDLDLTEAQLLEGLKELTAKFQKTSSEETAAEPASAS